MCLHSVAMVCQGGINRSWAGRGTFGPISSKLRSFMWDRRLKVPAPHAGIWPPGKPPTGLGRAACREKDNDGRRLRFPAARNFVDRGEHSPGRTARAAGGGRCPMRSTFSMWLFSAVVASLQGRSPPERGEQKADLRTHNNSRKRHVRNDRSLLPSIVQKGVSGSLEISVHRRPPPWTCSSDTPFRHQTFD